MAKKHRPARARLYANRRAGRAAIHCKGHRFTWDEKMRTFSCCGIIIACTSEGHCKIYNTPGPICDYVYLGPEHAIEFVARAFPHVYRSNIMEKERSALLARIASVRAEVEFDGAKGGELWWHCLTLESLLRDPFVPVGLALAHNNYARIRAIIQYELDKAGIVGHPKVLAYARRERA
jgi:hypothetical protein